MDPNLPAFRSRAAFLAACDAAGWARGPDNKPMPPDRAALQEIGPITAPPSIGADGIPMPGEVVDARYHVNAAWHGMEPPEVFQAAAVIPTAPNRGLSLPPMPPPEEPPVQAVIPARKGKVALREAGLLATVEAAVHAAGGRIRDAWEGASEWERSSDFQLSLATGIGLANAQVDELFRAADAIQG